MLAVTHRGIRVVYVTHIYQLAKSLSEMHDSAHIFLRTTLTQDGQANYQLHVGVPEPRSNALKCTTVCSGNRQTWVNIFTCEGCRRGTE